MPIRVECRCGKKFRAKDEHAGKRAKCPGCGRILTIGNSGALQAPTPSAPPRPTTPAPVKSPKQGSVADSEPRGAVADESFIPPDVFQPVKSEPRVEGVNVNVDTVGHLGSSHAVRKVTMRRRRVIVAVGAACTVTVLIAASILWWFAGDESVVADAGEQGIKVFGWYTTQKLKSIRGLRTQKRSQDIFLVVRVGLSPAALGVRDLSPTKLDEFNKMNRTFGTPARKSAWRYSIALADFKLSIGSETRMVASGQAYGDEEFEGAIEIITTAVKEPTENIVRVFFVVDREQAAASATTFQYKDFPQILLDASTREDP